MVRSPFPGMDPYVEAHWLDVNGSLVYLTKAALQPQLSDDLVARTEERIVVEDSMGVSRLIGLDGLRTTASLASLPSRAKRPPGPTNCSSVPGDSEVK